MEREGPGAVDGGGGVQNRAGEFGLGLDFLTSHLRVACVEWRERRRRESVYVGPVIAAIGFDIFHCSLCLLSFPFPFFLFRLFIFQ